MPCGIMVPKIAFLIQGILSETLIPLSKMSIPDDSSLYILQKSRVAILSAVGTIR